MQTDKTIIITYLDCLEVFLLLIQILILHLSFNLLLLPYLYMSSQASQLECNNSIVLDVTKELNVIILNKVGIIFMFKG